MQPGRASPRDLRQVYVGALSSNCHKLRMSETSAIKRALAPLQGPARTNGLPFPEDGRKIRNPAGSGAGFPDDELSHGESSPTHDETHFEAPASDISQPRDVAPHATEIELKLLVDADRLADFSDASVVGTNARNRG